MHEAAPIGEREPLLEELLGSVHTGDPSEALEAARHHGERIGLSGITLLLVDLQQRLPTPLSGGPVLEIDTTVAGHSSPGHPYRTSRDVPGDRAFPGTSPHGQYPAGAAGGVQPR
ncbi:hypothetical protein [Nocardiopsis sp. ATB16-24]|uniref:hypothetical protein n=1 Tax=Nocardiopsis sp. ATB16-24 TaxID=3019555 RepID=UPI0025534D6E|nr:hypothetical protein [Nocardiopsis sp. ATB16-24]